MGQLLFLILFSCFFFTWHGCHTAATSLQMLECEKKKFTYVSCEKVFCLPWQRCVDGTCICKLPYVCPKFENSVCSVKGRTFRNYCQLKSYECLHPEEKFSQRAPCNKGKLIVSLEHEKESSKGFVKVTLVSNSDGSHICNDTMQMNEANVVCRELGFAKGAVKVLETKKAERLTNLRLSECLTVHCRGLETSLAECGFKQQQAEQSIPTYVVCYSNDKACSGNEFQCVNGKCIPQKNKCNGFNDCGDLSDELCCESCKEAFHCKSDTCIPMSYRCNGEKDCITGEDELACDEDAEIKVGAVAKGVLKSEGTQPVHPASDKEAAEYVVKPMDKERKTTMQQLTEIQCGIVNMTSTRRKRLYGGEEAAEGQFPWQVAIDEEGEVNCGGVYIGGCWVLTAAHCVRANQPKLYRIKLGLYNRRVPNLQADSIAVEQVIVHENYNPTTYQNDIALLQMKNIYKVEECIPRSRFVFPACVPWSSYLFKPGDRCQISGWGRKEDATRVYVLRWGYIHLMPNCSKIYGDRFFEGMECAGTYDGKIDSCKGDSGGPMVCFGSDNVAYVWGIVSWGEKCGLAGYPGVYTKVAHYFDWISRHVGRVIISKYNV